MLFYEAHTKRVLADKKLSNEARQTSLAEVPRPVAPVMPLFVVSEPSTEGHPAAGDCALDGGEPAVAASLLVDPLSREQGDFRKEMGPEIFRALMLVVGGQPAPNCVDITQSKRSRSARTLKGFKRIASATSHPSIGFPSRIG